MLRLTAPLTSCCKHLLVYPLPPCRRPEPRRSPRATGTRRPQVNRWNQSSPVRPTDPPSGSGCDPPTCTVPQPPHHATNRARCGATSYPKPTTVPTASTGGKSAGNLGTIWTPRISGSGASGSVNVSGRMLGAPLTLLRSHSPAAGRPAPRDLGPRLSHGTTQRRRRASASRPSSRAAGTGRRRPTR